MPRVPFLCLAAVLAGRAFAQTPVSEPEDLYTLCGKALAADAEDRLRARDQESPELRAALDGDTDFWTFVVSTSTSYADRMAAAYRGATLISADDLPKVWKAYAEFRTLRVGVHASPCTFDARSWAARKRRVSAAETRSLFGYTIDLPERAVDYPLDLESRDDAPWLWQVRRAVNLLHEQVLARYQTAERAPELANAIVRWKPAGAAEQELRAMLLQNLPRSAARVQAILGIALDDGVVSADWWRPTDDAHVQELSAAALVTVLQQTRWQQVALAAAEELARMPESLRGAAGRAAIERWATDRRLDAVTRAAFATLVR